MATKEPRRYRIEWELDARMRATTYASLATAKREIHRRLYEQGHLNGKAYLWDGTARTWKTYYLVPGGHTRGGGRRNPELHESEGA